jgi:hypothetical protein
MYTQEFFPRSRAQWLHQLVEIMTGLSIPFSFSDVSAIPFVEQAKIVMQRMCSSLPDHTLPELVREFAAAPPLEEDSLSSMDRKLRENKIEEAIKPLIEVALLYDKHSKINLNEPEECWTNEELKSHIQEGIISSERWVLETGVALCDFHCFQERKGQGDFRGILWLERQMEDFRIGLIERIGMLVIGSPRTLKGLIGDNNACNMLRKHMPKMAEILARGAVSNNKPKDAEMWLRTLRGC